MIIESQLLVRPLRIRPATPDVRAVTATSRRAQSLKLARFNGSTDHTSQRRGSRAPRLPWFRNRRRNARAGRRKGRHAARNEKGRAARAGRWQRIHLCKKWREWAAAGTDWIAHSGSAFKGGAPPSLAARLQFLARRYRCLVYSHPPVNRSERCQRPVRSAAGPMSLRLKGFGGSGSVSYRS